ncbi:hypothetical protein HanIR_Chr01g0008421 [Helianthus annuus]|nr:hypothetical protein HanIR_Chr01g0008421 [Helianthus annuus]
MSLRNRLRVRYRRGSTIRLTNLLELLLYSFRYSCINQCTELSLGYINPIIIIVVFQRMTVHFLRPSHVALIAT